MRIAPVVASALFLVAVVAGCDPEPHLNLGISTKQHAAYFPIAGTAPHALGAAAQTGVPISCDTCHAGTDTFAAPVCISCHSHDDLPLDAVHGDIAGYVQADTSCYSCHLDGLAGTQGGVSIHSQLDFPIDPGDLHADAAYNARVLRGGTSCTACHASVTDRTQALCAECHAKDLAPDIVAAHPPPLDRSFKNDSVSCKECHADIPIDPIVHPLSGHDAIFSPDHHNAVCKNCHEAFQAEPKAWAIDFHTGTCTGCHTHPPDCTLQNQGPCGTPLP